MGIDIVLHEVSKGTVPPSVAREHLNTIVNRRVQDALEVALASAQGKPLAPFSGVAPGEEPGTEDAEIRILLEHVKGGEVPVNVAQAHLSILMGRRLETLVGNLVDIRDELRGRGLTKEAADVNQKINDLVGGEAG